MPMDVGYPMELVAADEITIEKVGGKLVRGDDRVTKIPAPSYPVELDFNQMAKGLMGESMPMELIDGNSSNGKKNGGKPKNGKMKY